MIPEMGLDTTTLPFTATVVVTVIIVWVVDIIKIVFVIFGPAHKFGLQPHEKTLTLTRRRSV